MRPCGARRSTRSFTKRESPTRRFTRSVRRSRTFSFHSLRNTRGRIISKRRHEDKSSKLQAPSTREAPSIKLQTAVTPFKTVWCLEFLWSLELGARSFRAERGFDEACTFPRPRRHPFQGVHHRSARSDHAFFYAFSPARRNDC